MMTAKFLLGAAAAAAMAGTAGAQFLAPAAVAPAPDPSAALNGVVPPPPDAVGIAPQPFPPNGPTVWSRLGIDPLQREYYRRKAARTPLGQLRAKIREPFSKLTGGVIPPFAPKTPSVAELKDPGPVGAAAKAKLDRAGAEERIKAVKYLATLDCHYWPEAEEALIGALRADRNECVRYEAAVALLNGCCCTCKVTVALSIAVSCSDADGNPTERSARVRAVAAHALDRCLSSACCAPELPPLVTPVPADGDKKPDPKGPSEGPRAIPEIKASLGDAAYPKQYYAAAAKTPRVKVAAMGRRALELGAQFGYDFTTPINDSDYVAAGLPASSPAGTAAEPTTLLELFAWSDSGAAIAQPPLAPPAVAAAAGPKPSPVRTALATAPKPALEMAPAPSPARLPKVVVSPAAEAGKPEKPAAAPPKVPSVTASATGPSEPKPPAAEPPKSPLVIPVVKPLPVTLAPASAPVPTPPKLGLPTPPASLPAPKSLTPPAPIVPAPAVAPKPSLPVVVAPIVPAPTVAPKPTPVAVPAVAVPAVAVPAVAVPAVAVPAVAVPAVAAPATQAPAPVVAIPPVPTLPPLPATQAPAPVVPLTRTTTEYRFPAEPTPLNGDYQPRSR